MSSQGTPPNVEERPIEDDELRALRKEVLSLRECEREQTDTTSSLINELQRRCDQVIELEVRCCCYSRARERVEPGMMLG